MRESEENQIGDELANILQTAFNEAILVMMTQQGQLSLELSYPVTSVNCMTITDLFTDVSAILVDNSFQVLLEYNQSSVQAANDSIRALEFSEVTYRLNGELGSTFLSVQRSFDATSLNFTLRNFNFSCSVGQQLTRDNCQTFFDLDS